MPVSNIHKALSHSVISVKAAHHSAPIQGEGHLTFMAISLDLICMNMLYKTVFPESASLLHLNKLSDMTTGLYVLCVSSSE